MFNINDLLNREKVQQWLEKRGRSVASCRHLGCLGHQLKDFKVPERKSSSVKSIRSVQPAVTETVETSVYASPQLKVFFNILKYYL
jgi:hypothetical protein